jgi:hypothetical protein
MRKSKEEVIELLLADIERESDIEQLVGRGGVGEASEDAAVNSLMAFYGDESIVISQYVMRQLVSRVTDDFIHKARYVSADRSSFLAELGNGARDREYLSCKIRGLLLTKKNGNNSAEGRGCYLGSPGSVGRQTILTPFTDASDLVLRSSRYGCWFRPTRWSHDLFDILYRPSEHELTVIQIADADADELRSFKLKLKLEYLIPYIKAMNVHVVDVVYVCRKKNFDNFRVPNPGGARKKVRITASSDRTGWLVAVVIEVEEALKKQFDEFMGFLHKVRADKTFEDKMKEATSTSAATRSFPPALISFRKICYQ